MSEYVWYLSYGSNMLKERFMCYIEGGTYKTVTEEGCRDKTPPVDEKIIMIPHRVYFAGSNKKWNDAGVAFIESEEKGLATCRMYKITKEQFVDVLKQENRLDEIPEVDFEKVMEKGQMKVIESEYDNMLYLGDHDGVPIFTFTCSGSPDHNRPDRKYVDTINSGVVDMNIISYFTDPKNYSEIREAVKKGLKDPQIRKIKERIINKRR